MVPSSLGYVNINRNGLIYPAASKIRACAWLTTQDVRGAEFDYTDLDNAQSSVLTQVKGLKLAVIAGSASNDTDDVDQE